MIRLGTRRRGLFLFNHSLREGSMKAIPFALLGIFVLLGGLLYGQDQIVSAQNQTIKTSLGEPTHERYKTFAGQPFQAASATPSHFPQMDQANQFSTGAGILVNNNLESSNLGYLGQIGGTSYAVAIQGNYAYVSSGPRLVVLNISDPAAPVEIGRTKPMPDLITHIAVEGDYAYVIAPIQELGSAISPNGLHIVNIANPATPYEVSFYYIPGNVQGVVVAGSNAYIVDDSGLRIIDFGDLANPIERGFLAIDYAQDVEVAGEYAYIVNYDRLQIVNVSDPAAPIEVGYYDAPVPLLSVAVAGSYAYVVGGFDDRYSTNGGLRIVKITNPAHPFEVGFYSLTGRASSIEVAGRLAYIGTTYYGLYILNITHPEAPYLVGQNKIAYPYDLAVSSGYAYVPTRYGLWIVNVSKPSAPFLASRYGIGLPNSVTIAGSYAYVTNGHGLRIINIAALSAPFEVGHYDSPGMASRVVIEDNYAFIADYENGLIIVNIANPADPYEVSTYHFPDYHFDIAVAGNFAYLTAETEGLRIIDISNPDALYEIGYYITSGLTTGVAVAGDYAYISDYDGLSIVNISDPAAPFLVGYDAGYGYDVVLDGQYAYLAGNMRIVDVSDPANPFDVGILPSGGNHIAVAGSFAYTSEINRLTIVNIAYRAAPQVAGFFRNNDSSAWDNFFVAAVDRDIFVATGVHGLFFLRNISDLDFENKTSLPLSMK
jgi:hypothetical protein